MLGSQPSAVAVSPATTSPEAVPPASGQTIVRDVVADGAWPVQLEDRPSAPSSSPDWLAQTRYGLHQSTGTVDMTTNEWVLSRPGPRLRPFVERYVGYRMAGYEPAMHRGLPSRHMTFIVSIGHTIDVVQQTSDAQAPGPTAASSAGSRPPRR